MKVRLLLAVLPLIFVSVAPFTFATASPGPVGEWKIADGTAKVAIRPCGADLCGFVTWSRDAASVVGQEVFINMKPSGNLWTGTAVNVADGETYTAQISVLGRSVLKVEGCVIGGLICGGQQWSRVR